MCLSLNHEHIFSINENLRKKKIKIFYVSLCQGRMDCRKSGRLMGVEREQQWDNYHEKTRTSEIVSAELMTIRERPKRSCGCYKNFTNSVTHLMFACFVWISKDDVFSCSIESWSDDVGWSTLSLSYTRNLIITGSAICLTLTRRLLGWDFAFAIWRVF